MKFNILIIIFCSFLISCATPNQNRKLATNNVELDAEVEKTLSEWNFYVVTPRNFKAVRGEVKNISNFDMKLKMAAHFMFQCNKLLLPGLVQEYDMKLGQESSFKEHIIAVPEGINHKCFYMILSGRDLEGVYFQKSGLPIPIKLSELKQNKPNTIKIESKLKRKKYQLELEVRVATEKESIDFLNRNAGAQTVEEDSI